METYAANKRLPVPFLRELGLKTVKSPYGKGADAVAIPYRDRDGADPDPLKGCHAQQEQACVGPAKRQRVGPLWPGQAAREGKPAFACGRRKRLPHPLAPWPCRTGRSGATNFKAGRDDAALEGYDVVALIEPDQGGEAMLSALRNSAHAARIRVAWLDGFKDPSELHCKAPDRFDAVIGAAIKTAKPLIEAKPAKADTKPKAAAMAVQEGDEERKRTQADVLVEIAAVHADLFATPGEEIAHAAITIEMHREVWPIKSRGFKRWLTHQYFLACGRAPNSDAMNQALATLDAMACYSGKPAPVFMRRAEHGGKLYLDLCDEAWRAIEIDAQGWRLVDRPPVYFIRAQGMLPLPVPERGGSIDELRCFLNVASDDDFRLITGWLLAALRPNGPYPILAMTGEGGTAKTSTARLLRSLVDPHAAKVRRPPQSERDLFISAAKTSVLVYDNLSVIGEWMSDALCVISTGGTYTARQLHTDAEEMIFSVCLPVMITSVGEVIARSDLASRAIVVSLAAIPEHARRSEEEFNGAIAAAAPRILSALLDAISQGLRELPHTKLDRLPRLADFIRWTQACEGAFWRRIDLGSLRPERRGSRRRRARGRYSCCGAHGLSRRAQRLLEG